MLDFHYSDFWADLTKQVKPKAWKELSGEALETAVYLHTVDTLKALKNHKLVPTMVQVGNEITKRAVVVGWLHRTDRKYGTSSEGRD